MIGYIFLFHGILCWHHIALCTPVVIYWYSVNTVYYIHIVNKHHMPLFWDTVFCFICFFFLYPIWLFIIVQVPIAHFRDINAICCSFLAICPWCHWHLSRLSSAYVNVLFNVFQLWTWYNRDLILEMAKRSGGRPCRSHIGEYTLQPFYGNCLITKTFFNLGVYLTL